MLGKYTWLSVQITNYIWWLFFYIINNRKDRLLDVNLTPALLIIGQFDLLTLDLESLFGNFTNKMK